jgi:hypothetical protein
MSTPSPNADRNLIFGLLALQMDFVSREQLIEAMTAWMLEKQTSLGQLLHERGLLTERRLAMLQGLVDEHVAQHGDPQASLAALRVEPEVRQDLDRLDDPEVQARVPPGQFLGEQTDGPATTGAQQPSGEPVISGQANE